MKLTQSHFLRFSIAAGALPLVQSIRRVVAIALILSLDNGPHMNSWPDAGMTPFRNEKNSNWEGAYYRQRQCEICKTISAPPTSC